MQVERKIINSVGIDIGTTTTHLIFSRLVLETDPFSPSNKLELADREVTYRSAVHFTPLVNENREIDTEGVISIIEEEYAKAGVNASTVDTGAVIITGESSRKTNASLIVERIAADAGGFVGASAGPNFESIMSAHGSGAVKYSEENGVNLVHCDIGGGTTKLSYIECGEIKATASLDIGGRLVAYDDGYRVFRLEKSGKRLLRELGEDMAVGDVIEESTLQGLADLMSSVLVEVLRQGESSKLVQELMITPPLPRGITPTQYSFSGGVAEYIYGLTSEPHGDVGHLLGWMVREKAEAAGLTLAEPPEKIRATVIGASGFTLKVSGYTTYTSETFRLPIRNVPIATPHIDKRGSTEEHIVKQITDSLRRLDLLDDAQPLALAFHDPVGPSYERLRSFSKAVEKALTVTFHRQAPVVLVFDTDIGNSVGNVLRKETGIENILSIDEISLSEGEFIDVGAPLPGGDIYPVIIKSLVFN
ncbi:ethanolamine ammonia-lyase reactivating factor EutA [Candidatus Bathyarchaeota archaeon]|nr:ethanolamine ammonia-lyase reactivating factor EutA [Candidatus Bathyarchaeota archaeon]